MIDVIGVAADGVEAALREILAPLVSAVRSNREWQPYRLEHERLFAGVSRSLHVHAVPFG